MAEASQRLQEYISNDQVVVFSKSYCPYCKATKKALKDMGATFKAYELDELSNGGALQDAIEELTGQRTVPNTFIKQQSIGGNSDLQSLLSAGKLQNMLQDVGALEA